MAGSRRVTSGSAVIESGRSDPGNSGRVELVREAAVTLTADESGRLAGLLEQQAEQIVKQWTDTVAASMRGRLSHAELFRQVHDLHRTLLAALTGGEFELAGGED
jgi:hypothetical protein